MFKRNIQHNLKYYTWYYTISGLIFPIPIWVAFYTQVITLEQLALINAIESLVTLTLEVPTGALADILGRRRTIIIGSIMLSIFFFAVPFANSFLAILLLSLVSGAGSALISGSDSALIYDSLKEQKQEASISSVYTKIGLYYRISLIIATLAAGFMFSLWRGFTHFARGIVVLVASCFIYFMVEPKLDSIKFSWAGYFRQTKQGIAELTKSLFIKKLAIYYVAVAGISFSCLAYFNQPFAYDFGYTPSQMSFITSAAYLITSLILYFITTHDRFLTRKRVYLGFPLLMSLSLLPGLLVDRTFALLIMMGAQLAGSARFSILDKYINKEFSSQNRATALSTLNMGVSLTMATLIFFGGQIQGIYDTRHAYVALGIITIMIVLPLGISLVREHNRYHQGIA